MIVVGKQQLNREEEKLVHVGLLTLFWEYRNKPNEQAAVSRLLELCKGAENRDRYADEPTGA